MKRIAVAALVGIVLLVVGGLGVGWWAFNKIEKVEVADVLSPPSPNGMNILVVGTDSREGIEADAENADAFLGGGFSDAGPSRTDTMMILRIDDDGQTLLSIPRDLWVRNPVTGENGRINAVYQSGRPALIQAVQGLGIPVHHYMEINFVSFAGLVDAVGGIEIDFPHPARDTNSGLDVPEAGTRTLDGVEALAYVRSRYYTELIDGEWVSDPTADLGRVTRQRAFVSALLRKVAGTKNPFTALSLAQTLGDSAGLKLDDALSYPEALGLGWQLRSFDPASETLPVVGVNRGGASTLDLGPGADAVIAQFQ